MLLLKAFPLSFSFVLIVGTSAIIILLKELAKLQHSFK